jgi:alpha-beta hydrolase superfamily lysophospholipase
MFHGARTSDAHDAASALRKGLGRSQILVGVGYSLGAIILSNYVASYGTECALDAAIAISGGLDMRQQEHFVRAQRLWQPMLAEDLREVFLIGKWGERVRARLPKDVMLNTMRASHITVRRKETKEKKRKAFIYHRSRVFANRCLSGN